MIFWKVVILILWLDDINIHLVLLVLHGHWIQLGIHILEVIHLRLRCMLDIRQRYGSRRWGRGMRRELEAIFGDSGQMRQHKEGNHECNIEAL